MTLKISLQWKSSVYFWWSAMADYHAEWCADSYIADQLIYQRSPNISEVGRAGQNSISTMCCVRNKDKSSPKRNSRIFYCMLCYVYEIFCNQPAGKIRSYHFFTGWRNKQLPRSKMKKKRIWKTISSSQLFRTKMAVLGDSASGSRLHSKTSVRARIFKETTYIFSQKSLLFSLPF